MANRRSQCIRRIRRDGSVELQNAPHHELHLRLLGAAGTDHGLLDLPRRILEYLGVRIDGAADRRTARLAQFQGAVRISIDEHPLDGDFLRPVLRHHGAYTAKYFAQAHREFSLLGANDAARHVGESRPGRVHYAEPGALRARIDTEHPHRRD